MRQEGRQHLRQNRPGSDATGRRRVSQSARAQRLSAAAPPKNSSSKALQWAQAVSVKTTVGTGSSRPPRVASCPPRRQSRGPDTAGRLSGEDTTSGHVECVGGRDNLGRRDDACADESRDTRGKSSVDTGHHDGRAVGGARLSAAGVGDEVHEYFTDGDGYSDDSFHPDCDNVGTGRNHEEPYDRELRTSDDGNLSDFEHHKVDAIPSTLVETGRGVDG